MRPGFISFATDRCTCESDGAVTVLTCLPLLRVSCHRDIINLQVEMVRQFCIQLVRTTADFIGLARQLFLVFILPFQVVGRQVLFS